jgi:hypothetical protein
VREVVDKSALVRKWTWQSRSGGDAEVELNNLTCEINLLQYMFITIEAGWGRRRFYDCKFGAVIMPSMRAQGCPGDGIAHSVPCAFRLGIAA